MTWCVVDYAIRDPDREINRVKLSVTLGRDTARCIRSICRGPQGVGWRQGDADKSATALALTRRSHRRSGRVLAIAQQLQEVLPVAVLLQRVGQPF
jgi:hypothetical protein